MSEAFFEQEDEQRFRATDHTRGPWTPEAQHAGPPAALLGRAIERTQPREGFQIARVTFEILRPIPVDSLTLKTHLARPGRSVELIEALMEHEGTPVVHARAWRIRTEDLDIERVLADDSPPPSPAEGRAEAPLGSGGYLDAMEVAFVKGSFVEPGPATAWFRMRHPLLQGEPVSPLTRVLIAADSGNGISATIDWSKWFFINTDLSVYLHRMPEGDWVCLDAVTTVQPHGIGLASSAIRDEVGPIGRGEQSLYIGPRR